MVGNTKLFAGTRLIIAYSATVDAGVVEEDVVDVEVRVLVSTLRGCASRSREQLVLKGALELKERKEVVQEV